MRAMAYAGWLCAIPNGCLLLQDMSPWEAMRSIRCHGLRVPGRYFRGGFDDLFIAAYTNRR